MMYRVLHTGSWKYPAVFLPLLFLHSVMPDTGYITYRPGTMNLILTVPHNGLLKPDNIQSRYAGCWNSTNRKCVFVHDCDAIGLREDDWHCWVFADGLDWYSLEVTEALSDALYNMTSQRPYVIINRLYRGKVDMNRPRDRAAFDDPIAIAAWEDWHRYINQAKASIGGPALMLDMHTHGHKEGNVELGYLILGEKLDNDEIDPNNSSIRYLASRTNTPFEELLRGANSLGTFLSEEGYPTVPSLTQPGPNGTSYYAAIEVWTNTAEHGSMNGGIVDAIQIESPWYGLLDSADIETTIIEYAGALARSIVRYRRLYYNDQGVGVSLHAPQVCSRPLYHLRPFFSCLLCSESFPSQIVHCDHQHWKPYSFNHG